MKRLDNYFKSKLLAWLIASLLGVLVAGCGDVGRGGATGTGSDAGGGGGETGAGSGKGGGGVETGSTATPLVQQAEIAPDFKMPLPGGFLWRVTTEIGGTDCMGKIGDLPYPDPAHTGKNYYSIDITWVNKDSNGMSPTIYGQDNTPVLAAAAGKVFFAGAANPEVGNGNYVVINHNNDAVNNTGFSTRYLHLKDPPARKDGTPFVSGVSVVAQGDQIGIMGTTGTLLDGTASSTGVHLHFGVRYNDSGLFSVPELTKVVMEGLLLKSYQTECAVNSSDVPTSRIDYYPSTMVSTGI